MIHSGIVPWETRMPRNSNQKDVIMATLILIEVSKYFLVNSFIELVGLQGKTKLETGLSFIYDKYE